MTAVQTVGRVCVSALEDCRLIMMKTTLNGISVPEVLHDHRQGGQHHLCRKIAGQFALGRRLVGVRVEGLRAAVLIIEPLFAPSQLRWFAATRLLIRRQEVAVAYDADGSRYGGWRGLAVWVNGVQVAHSEVLRRIELPNLLPDAV